MSCALGFHKDKLVLAQTELKSNHQQMAAHIRWLLKYKLPAYNILLVYTVGSATK